MSHYMTALAMKQTGLKPAAKIVLYWLADHHNSETGACFPSLARLAEECEMGKASVIRHLNSLEESGLISRQQRHRENGSQSSTEYILHLDDPVSKRDSPCIKMRQAPVSNCDPHNLGNTNLGSEPLYIDGISVFDAFNEIAQKAGWPSVQKRSKSRERVASQRIKECGGFENWKDAMQRAAASDFLSGKATGTTPATFDWLHKPANFTKLMEGNYDNRTKSAQNSKSDTSAREIAFAAAAIRTPSDDCF